VAKVRTAAAGPSGAPADPVRYPFDVQFLRDIAKKVLPDRFVHWYRRRRIVRSYLRELGYEMYDRNVRLELEDLEGRIAARRDGFYQQMVRDVLERTELILQELDRRIEALGARHGNELRELRREIRALQEAVGAAPRNPAGQDLESLTRLDATTAATPLSSAEPGER
jgi:hypothetical protein